MDMTEIALIAGCVFMVIVLVALLVGAYKDGFLGEYQAAPIISYYTKYRGNDTDRIVVGLHSTSWCGYCKVMKPVWNQLKEVLANIGANVLMVENDEDANPQPWVRGYPTIVRLYHGKIQEYKGPANFEQLKAFVLNPSNQDWW